MGPLGLLRFGFTVSFLCRVADKKGHFTVDHHRDVESGLGFRAEPRFEFDSGEIPEDLDVWVESFGPVFVPED